MGEHSSWCDRHEDPLPELADTFLLDFSSGPVYGHVVRNLEALSGHGGRPFAAAELELIKEVVGSCGGLSRKELSQTVCELLEWKRPSGGLKALECAAYLDRLEAAGVVELPQKQRTRPVGSRTRIPVTQRGDPGQELVGEVAEFAGPGSAWPWCRGWPRLWAGLWIW